MATNRIKIEVDFDNAVAKINDLKIKFDEIGDRAVATRNRIQQMVKSTKDATDGSVKALQRERAAWQQIQASLSSTNEQYRKYQVQIDALDKQIAKITDTRKREEIALKNSANGIRQQIELIKQEMENRKLSNTQYRVMNEEVAKLEARLQALTDTRQKHQVVQKGSIADFDQQIAVLREEQRNTALSADEIERYEQKIESLRLRKRALTGETKGLDKASQSFSSSAGAAGATVTEFGRTIGDLPFGLIGITNNIQQLSQQFTDLQAKSGGFKSAMESVKATLMGPAGFVVAINIVTSALLYFTRQNQKAKSATDNFDESLIKNKTTLQNLVDVVNESNISLETRNDILRAGASLTSEINKLYEDESLTEEERNKRVTEALRLQAKLIGLEEKRNKFLDKNKEVLAENIMSEEELAVVQENLSLIMANYQGNSQGVIKAILDEINAQGERREVLAEFLSLQLDAIDAEREFKDAVDTTATAQEKYVDTIREVNRQVAEDQETLQSDQLKKRREFLLEDIRAEEENSDKRLELQGELYKLNAEIEKAISEEKKEADKKEKERLDSLNEMNQEYLDNLTAQYDESGIARLKQQERDAIKEAEALGASQRDLLRIRKYYANEIQKVEFAAAEKASEERAKENEKKAKEDEKKQKESLEKNKKRLEEFFDQQLEIMKQSVDNMSDIFSNFGTLLDELNNISQARFERQIGQLREERDIIRSNDALTKEEKEQQLTDLRIKENEFQRDRINAEYRMFALTQTLSIAEMAMKERAAFRERQLTRQKFIEEQKFLQLSIINAQLKAGTMTALEAHTAITAINLNAAEQAGKATMSIGAFMEQLGPLGIAAFALSIGGVLASIFSAKRKANAEIAGLSDAPVSLGGAGGGAAPAPAAPSFNVVGASAQNQLAAAIAGQQSEPIRAYVVSSDVSTAQELDRKIVEGASI